MPTYIVTGQDYTGTQRNTEIDADSVPALLLLLESKNSSVKCRYTLEGNQLRATLFEGTVSVKRTPVEESLENLADHASRLLDFIDSTSVNSKFNEVSLLVVNLKCAVSHVTALLAVRDIPLNPQP